MAQETVVVLRCDLDGEEAERTVSFALDGKSYEMELCEGHRAGLEEVLAPFIDGARPARRSPRGVSRRNGSTPHAPNLAAVRAWARKNGMKVSDRGRIPASVTEAYEASR
jgi:hypothetical protein